MNFPAYHKFTTVLTFGGKRLRVEVSGIFEAPWQFVSNKVEREETGRDITDLLNNHQTCLVDSVGSEQYGEFEGAIAEERADRMMDR